jgi:hypothetical protein
MPIEWHLVDFLKFELQERLPRHFLSAEVEPQLWQQRCRMGPAEGVPVSAEGNVPAAGYDNLYPFVESSSVKRSVPSMGVSDRADALRIHFIERPKVINRSGLVPYHLAGHRPRLVLPVEGNRIAVVTEQRVMPFAEANRIRGNCHVAAFRQFRSHRHCRVPVDPGCFTLAIRVGLVRTEDGRMPSGAIFREEQVGWYLVGRFRSVDDLPSEVLLELFLFDDPWIEKSGGRREVTHDLEKEMLNLLPFGDPFVRVGDRMPVQLQQANELVVADLIGHIHLRPCACHGPPAIPAPQIVKELLSQQRVVHKGQHCRNLK